MCVCILMLIFMFTFRFVFVCVYIYIHTHMCVRLCKLTINIIIINMCTIIVNIHN